MRTNLTLVCRDTHFDTVRKVAGDSLKVEQL